MRVAVIDVGSNTARLLVADVAAGALSVVAEDRAFLELGADHPLDPPKLSELRRVARRFTSRAGKLHVEETETIVTAPGRNGDGHVLIELLREVTGSAVRILSAEQEGCLAWAGAVAAADELPEVVAVVDVGGGSTEVVVGTPWVGASWVRSLGLGSLRLARSHLEEDPASARQLAQARDAVRRQLADIEPPWSDVALATGGSARAVAKVTGQTYSADELWDAVAALSSHPVRAIPHVFGINARRARTVVAGAIVLSELARLLGRPLVVAGGGLREGAAFELAADAAARAAA